MIEKIDVEIKTFHTTRTLHIYLPHNYETSNERYPVVYMFDGHNLFHDESATYGKSWGLEEFLDQYDKKLIIVGMECNHEGNERLNEYCPYDVQNAFNRFNIRGKGIAYMEWLCNDLKPFIDTKYRTLPFRECTAIAGSSMGGLLALYALICHNNIFSKAACLSPSITICSSQLLIDLNKVELSQDSRIYMSFGTKEVRNLNLAKENYQSFINLFKQKGVFTYLNIIKNGQHNELTWQKQNKTYLDFLWK